MMKRAFFVFVLFGIVLAGAVVTSASPSDPVEVVAAAESDTTVSAPLDANTQTAIVNKEPRGCKYPDICPPPPPPPATCVGKVTKSPWVSSPRTFDTKGSFGIAQQFVLSHKGCGEGALSNIADAFDPTTRNPWTVFFGGRCDFKDGTWVFSTNIRGANFTVRSTNGATNTPVPVVVTGSALDCTNVLKEKD